MRGKNNPQTSMMAMLSLESLVPPDHPLRPVKRLADEALRRMSETFDQMYEPCGRESVPPERLLKATLLMALFSVRSERMLCEQLAYNMLFRWFLDMNMTDVPFDHSSFSKNRERLLKHEVGARFLQAVVEQAREADLLSADHFSVDGTMIQAWGSTKSFRPKGEEKADTNGYADFKGTKRSNETHASTTDPDSRLWRKGKGREAVLSHMGHVLTENRNALVVDCEVTEASGHAERDAALKMVDRERKRRQREERSAKRRARSKQRRHSKGRRITLGADKAYDTKDFVAACRAKNVTPHVAQNITANRGSAIDGRTTEHVGYAQSQRARKRCEQPFGWAKVFGGVRRSRYRGLNRTRLAFQLSVAAYNLVRMPKLMA
jgi:transposase